MNTIQDISAISSYRPDNGDLLHVFELFKEDMTRADALASWRKGGKSDEHFRWVYKRLKERLLKGVLIHSFSEFEEHKKRRIECWRRFAEVKIILTADKRESAIELAVEVMREAEKCGMVEVALSLARDLAYQSGVLDADIRKYRRYRRKVRLLWDDMQWEKQAQELFTELVFLHHKKRDYSHLETEIKATALIKSDSVRFNLFRYSLLAFWHRIKGDHSKIIETCLKAINFFDKVTSSLPYTSKWNFYRQMIPYLIANKDFALAESKIKSCLSLPAIGSLNWHITLLQMAMLGFRSNKPKIAYRAWLLAMQHVPDIDWAKEYWETVHAYLSIYQKLGRLEMERDFRLSRFTNSVENAKLSTRVAMLIHLLLDDNKMAYMKAVERIPDFLRKEQSARGRCMLRMLANVEKGDYYRIRVSAMAKRDWNTLQRTPVVVSIDFIDNEVILFEDLWEIVLGRLR